MTSSGGPAFTSPVNLLTTSVPMNASLNECCICHKQFELPSELLKHLSEVHSRDFNFQYVMPSTSLGSSRPTIEMLARSMVLGQVAMKANGSPHGFLNGMI